jgi:hypothetical protein
MVRGPFNSLRASAESPGPETLTPWDPGITAQLSEQLRIDGERKLAESWAKITRGEGGLKDFALLTPRMVARAIKFVSAPAFEHWIPALKVNAAIMEAQAALRRDPSLLTDPVRRRLALRAIGKSIENRFGEMFYGSLFWNRYVKDAGIASFLRQHLCVPDAHHLVLAFGQRRWTLLIEGGDALD